MPPSRCATLPRRWPDERRNGSDRLGGTRDGSRSARILDVRGGRAGASLARPGHYPLPVKELLMDRRPPDLSITIDNGIDRLDYRLCSICETLQTRIRATLPTICEDCYAVVTR